VAIVLSSVSPKELNSRKQSMGRSSIFHEVMEWNLRGYAFARSVALSPRERLGRVGYSRQADYFYQEFVLSVLRKQRYLVRVRRVLRHYWKAHQFLFRFLVRSLYSNINCIVFPNGLSTA